MKNGQWFQKIIRVMILITGFYILYRGGGILAETGWLKQIFQSEATKTVMQDTAVRLYFPTYFKDSALWPGEGPVQWWLGELVPMFQDWYMRVQEAQSDWLQNETGQTEGPEQEGETSRQDGAESGEGQAGEAEEGSNSGTETETEAENVTETETETEVKDETEAETETEVKDETVTEAETEVKAEIGTETKIEMGTEQETGSDPARETPAHQEVSALPAARMELLADYDYLLNHYFVVDSDTMPDASLLDAKKLLGTDLKLEKDPEQPQILIYHTHSQEWFVDSEEGVLETGIVGIGTYLEQLLEEEYGYQVIHDTGVYDLVGGVLDRSAAYDYARASIEQILAEHPSIEVIIDLHRDGVEEIHFVTETQGEDAARIMFFNGISRNSEGEAVSYLSNPYIQENLAFSFQLQMAAEKSYPGFTRNIYLKGQRYNLHLRPRSVLIEAGTQLNTIAEEKRAMELLADILDQVLTGNK